MANISSLDFLIKFITDTTGVTQAKVATDSLKTALESLGLTGANSSRLLSTSLNQVNGTVTALKIQHQGLDGAIVKSTLSMDKMGNVTKTVTNTVNESAKGHLSLADNVARLAERAAITIPIWLALRSAFTSTLGVISDSTKSIVDLDEALKNVQNELQGTTNLPGAMKEIKKAAIDLSTQTGKGPAEIVETLRQFATAGFDAKDSMAGMNTAVKGAIATNGDATETARMLADVYNQMGDRITEVSGTQNKFNYIMSTIATLMPKNVFSVKEFTEALKNFLGTAKSSNLTLDQTFTLIASSATAMQRGARGGTQLASAFNQVVTEGAKIRDFLGHSLQGQNDFDIFLETVKKASEVLNSTGNLPTDIQKIFGLKGGKDVKALTADFSQFASELERISKLSPDDRMAALIERYGTASEKIALQLDRLKQVREELIRTFIDGTFSGTDFGKTLESVNTKLLNMKDGAHEAGVAVNELVKALAIGATVAAGVSAVTGRGAIAALLSKAGPIGMMAATMGVGAVGIATESQGVLDEYKKTSELEDENFKKFLITNDFKRKQKGLKPLHPELDVEQDLGKIAINGRKAMEGKTTDANEENLKIDDKILLVQQQMTAAGYNELELIQKRIQYLLQEKGRADDIYKARIEYLRLYNEEISKSSQMLQNTFSSSLSSLLQGQSSLKDFGKKISDTIRGGIVDSLAGNISEQLFKTTGLGTIFGSITTGLRHANDGIGAPIESAFDYGAQKSYDAIVKGFSNGLSGAVGGAGGATFGGLPGGIGSAGGGLTLPGFGPGGFFSRPMPGTGGGVAAMTGKNGQLLTASGAPVGGMSWGTGLGLGIAGGTAGFSAYQSAGGSQGSLSIPAGITGAIGGTLAAGVGLATFGGATGAAMLGALAPMFSNPITAIVAGALIIGSMIFSAASKTKTTSTQTQTQTQQIASKVDVTNKQLQLVNRNLVAIKSSLDTYIMPNSAYFSTKTNLEDQFSIDSRRA